MNLTINEQLMNDTKDANLCIFVANLSTWLRTNAGKLHKPLEQRNFYEGRYWSYNSIEGFVKYFGFWSTQNIKTIIKRAISHGLIIINTFNKKKFDNTLWYSLTDKALEYYPQLRDLTLNTLVSSNKRLVSSNNAIPENTTTSSNNTITTNSESVDSRNSSNFEKSDYLGNCDNDGLDGSEVVDSTRFMLKSDYQKNQTEKESHLLKKEHSSGKRNDIRLKKSSKVNIHELIEIYREIFPNNPQPHPRLISTSLQRTLQALIKKWPEADPEGRALDLGAFRRYMELLRETAPKFSLGEYMTKDGNKKKNNMETFCRWNTLVKFLENAYS